VTLCELWEICIPKFIAVGKVGFCYAIVLQDLKVIFLTYSFINDRQRPSPGINICPLVKDKIKKAYLELHRRNVLHGDVRASNILVSIDKSVFIVDFEFTQTSIEFNCLESEMTQVTSLFDKAKREMMS